jgi:hypothetical protein
MSATITTAPNGLRLLEAVKFDCNLCAALIATRDDWQELLDSLPSPNLRKNVAVGVGGIREALGLEAAYALWIRPFIQALQAIVDGSRDRALADTPGLHYRMAAEILFLLETLEEPQ